MVSNNSSTDKDKQTALLDKVNEELFDSVYFPVQFDLEGDRKIALKIGSETYTPDSADLRILARNFEKIATQMDEMNK